MKDKLTFLSLLFFLLITKINCDCTIQNGVIALEKEHYSWSNDFYFSRTYGKIINCTGLILNSKTQLKSQIKEDNNAAAMIIISQSSMPIVETAIFDSYRKVKKLFLDNNNINDIQPYSFAEMTNLTELHVTNNKLTKIRDGAFSGITKLKVLNLSFNKLTNLDNINVISTLEQLNLSSNLIGSISEKDFKNFESLNTLDLSNNLLTKLHFKVFINLVKLEDLFLRNNSLTTYTNDLFSHPIMNLDISWNQLDSIQCEQIRKSVLIMHNFITSLCTFHNEMTTIDFSEADLEEIPKGVFKDLDKLNFLNLSTNFLTAIDVDAFENLYNLTTLSISVNELTHIQIGTFKHLENLLILNMSWNRIESLDLGIFTGLNSLTTLDLSNNAMRSFDPRILYPVKDLEELYLHGNLLYTLDSRAITNHLMYLKHISVNFVQIGCDALMYTMNQFKNERVKVKQGQHVKGHNLDGIQCDPNIEGIGRKNYQDDILILIGYISSIQTIFILTVVIFIIILIMKSLNVYHKNFEYCRRRYSKRDAPSCSLTLLTENDHD